MKTCLLLVLANFQFLAFAYATVFQPLPIDKLIQPADAIVLGDYLSKKSVELEDGTLATEARFKIDREMGLGADDFGLSEIKVYFPGGKLGQRVKVIEGAPSFVSGEKNVIMLTQREDGRLWIQGLAMGTFRVVRMGEKTLLMNPVFPTHPELSRIELDQFLKKVIAIKDKPLKEIQSDKYFRELQKESTRTSKVQTGNSRSIASLSKQTDNKGDLNVMNSFWLVMTLGFLGALATWGGRKKMR